MKDKIIDFLSGHCIKVGSRKQALVVAERMDEVGIVSCDYSSKGGTCSAHAERYYCDYPNPGLMKDGRYCMYRGDNCVKVTFDEFMEMFGFSESKITPQSIEEIL